MSNQINVRKAVIPVAGFGTRFLPASKVVPKNMLPVFDTPAIQFAVQEAVEAGIEQVVIVVSEKQEAIRNHFKATPDLEVLLERRGDETLLESMKLISDMVDIKYVCQKSQLGLGHAVLMTRRVIGDEPFAVLLPDDLIFSDTPTIGEMIEMFKGLRGSIISVREVASERISSLGIIKPLPMRGRMLEVESLVEKPELSEAPSNLAIVGRYVLHSSIFDMLERTPSGAVGEIQITDAISLMLSNQRVYAYRFPGVHFDVGTPLGLLRASAHVASDREEIRSEFREWLVNLI